MIYEEEWLRDHADKNSAGCYAAAIDALRERLERSRTVIGECTLYNEDCAFVLPHTGVVDALVTDPPYGLGIAKRGRIGGGGLEYEPSDWDNDPIDPDLMGLIVKRGRWKIVFGGNYYMLPPAKCWLLWVKPGAAPSMADFEMAWTNLDKPAKLLKKSISSARAERGFHPTQKPVNVMMWCIGELPPEAKVILDPFMGSGTTGVACVKMGRKFIGIERDKKYFDAACRRIEEAYQQPRLDLPEPGPCRAQLDLIDPGPD